MFITEAINEILKNEYKVLMMLQRFREVAINNVYYLICLFLVYVAGKTCKKSIFNDNSLITSTFIYLFTQQRNDQTVH